MAKDLDIGMRCIKQLLFVSNAIFVMIGFMFITIGTTITAIYQDFDIFVQPHYANPAVIVVVVGAITFFVAVFGCVGAIKESTMMVNLYALFLLITLIVELSASVIAYLVRGDIYALVEDTMYNAMSKYGENDSATQSWDFTQERLMCCGVHDLEDWKYLDISGTEVNFGNETFGIPKTCCNFPNCQTLYEYGCLDRIASIISECAFMLGSGTLSVAALQFLGIIFSGMLAKAIRRNKTTREMKRQLKRKEIYEQLMGASEKKLLAVGSEVIKN